MFALLGANQTYTKMLHRFIILFPQMCDMKTIFVIMSVKVITMYHVWISQVVGFYWQNIWKTPVEEWHFK